MSQEVKVRFINHKEESIVVNVNVPEDESLCPTLFEIARQNEISIEGACGGVLACATCHVHVPDPFYDRLPIATEQEEAMLDMAQELEPDQSRLCCQVKVTKELLGDNDEIIVRIPESSENKSGHVH